jgi:hypothetical protein
MPTPYARRWPLLALAVGLLSGLAGPPAAPGAGAFFAAKGKEANQPGQQVLLCWDPDRRLETLTIQPRFEGTAPDFAIVVPTPSRPKILPAPRDLFRQLAVFTRLKKRAFPASRLVPSVNEEGLPAAGPAEAPVTVLEAGVVGAHAYKVVGAERADELRKWLAANKYHFAGGDAALDHYVRKKWFFAVFKADATRLARHKDGSSAGEVSPLCLQFTTDRPVYPLRILRETARDRTDVIFYVQAPFKADLPGDLSYREQRPAQRGRTPTSLEWARRLTKDDLALLRGEAPYSETVPDVDDGFTAADLRDPARARAIARVIRRRVQQALRERPDGYRVREASPAEVRGLRPLADRLSPGLFLTRFRKVFTRDELADDLFLAAARLGPAEDRSERVEALPSTPP